VNIRKGNGRLRPTRPLVVRSLPAKDKVFREPQKSVADFSFGEKVASVFDDMLLRSVPFYEEIQRMIAELAAEFAVDGTNVYDLGCSTGTTLIHLGSKLPQRVKFIGMDNSPEMLKRCRKKLAEHRFKRDHELICVDLNQSAPIENASVVLMVLTLQFIRPLHRERLIAEIRSGLIDNGCLIVVEKVLGEDSLFNRLFIKNYYEFKKRNGYSELEIARKREALENVLIPYKLLENRELLLRSGFRYCDAFFKWYNFSGLIAVK
jgi:tRNA (cmo5U34)-methyltransferase